MSLSPHKINCKRMPPILDTNSPVAMNVAQAFAGKDLAGTITAEQIETSFKGNCVWFISSDLSERNN